MNDIPPRATQDAPHPPHRPLLGRLRHYLVAGLLVWVPLVVTWWVVITLVDLMDRTLVLIPPQYRPDELLGFHVPGLGVILALTLLLLTGLSVANFLGRQIVATWEGILERIPLVRSIYSAVKQVMQTFFSTDSKSFRKVLLVQYPSKGLWSLAFLAGEPVGEVQAKTEKEVLTVYVPTAPNPTSGYVIFAAREDVIELDMPVEDAMRMILSLGMVAPTARPAAPLQVAPPEARP